MPDTTSYADYQVLSSVQHTLDAATSKREVNFEFTVYTNFVNSNASRRPVLMFHARVHKQTQLKVSVNGHQVLSWTLGTDGAVKGLWQPWSAVEVFPEGVSFANPTTVRFSVPQTGKIDIENVLMWYQVTDAA
jgi:hypothetical protein